MDVLDRTFVKEVFAHTAHQKDTAQLSRAQKPKRQSCRQHQLWIDDSFLWPFMLLFDRHFGQIVNAISDGARPCNEQK